MPKRPVKTVKERPVKTLEELEKELGEANLVIKETITDWGEIWTKCEYDL